ncbi:MULTISPECIES: glutathione peroxidase [Paenibacillus]|uniref:glutathione peroxidase n=1 Tax=Paenibacillus TaxID=44249 RepID=UPI000C9FFAD2|nr:MULTISPECIES: glutathione peroxidase [Paenibacillus]KAF6632998.1 glutathione peroxidase [Paenibacillus sp. EKM208P]PNQ79944.1 glutathione peroxidase [Paenibacillus sp. F4]WCM62591.1 glutathione peroxidase [Paenibacillus polymyxa]WDZ55601.1 glutathione peroxidase [Paenibacillus polymyxa]
MTVYEYDAQTLQGKQIPLSTYEGNVLLIVNTASKCGLTPQYKALQELYDQYHEQGLEILGFPSNQFAKQEPGSSEEISEFCQINYGVTFPMFAKTDVNGDQAHPLFRYLTQTAPGVLGSKAIKWNFTKFLITREGNVFKRYAPQTTPDKLAGDIEKLLQQN